jgi:hypothetical protein
MNKPEPPPVADDRVSRAPNSASEQPSSIVRIRRKSRFAMMQDLKRLIAEKGRT